MKASLRDHLTILMAFAAVFLCGFGIGNLLAKRQVSALAVANEPSWESISLSNLTAALELDQNEARQVEEELALTAARIEESRFAALLSYHQHLDDLYGRLIANLDEPRASRLRQEKIELENAIRNMKNLKPSTSPNQ
jgi:uncharacterized protein YdcH (DUF465 family)